MAHAPSRRRVVRSVSRSFIVLIASYALNMPHSANPLTIRGCVSPSDTKNGLIPAVTGVSPASTAE